MKVFDVSGYFNSMPVNNCGPKRIEVIYLLVLSVLALLLGFYGLGDVGLHGDEETMGMPVRSIVATGVPLLPSEMFYSRGLSQLYLMALSVNVFGESEWSLRLPSVLIASLIPIVSWLLGRRFLGPIGTFFFVLTMVLLPENIEASQTARFYLFYLITVMLFLMLILKWNETQRFKHLLLAVLVFCVGLDYQPLMVFSLAAFAAVAFIDYSNRKLLLSFLGIALCVFGYLAHDAFLDAMYQDSTRLHNIAASGDDAASPASRKSSIVPIVLTFLTSFGLGFALYKSYKKTGLFTGYTAASCVLSAVSAVSGSYSLAVIFLGVCTTFTIRQNLSLRWPLLAFAVLLSSVLFGAHSTGELSLASVAVSAREGTRLLSIWPWIIFLQQFTFGSLIHITLIGAAILLFVRAQKLPFVVALYLLGVVLPITIIGLFEWYPPKRYMYGFVPLFALTTYALAENSFSRVALSSRKGISLLCVFLVVLCISLVRPSTLLKVVGKGCATIINSCEVLPDHRGQASFIQGLGVSEQKIVVAEDVLQQTYYLGAVDYWLLKAEHANQFVRNNKGTLLDIYTGTPTLTNADSLRDLLQSTPRPAIYVVMNPEAQAKDGLSHHLDSDMNEVLSMQNRELVYSGKQGREKIWRYPASN